MFSQDNFTKIRCLVLISALFPLTACNQRTVQNQAVEIVNDSVIVDYDANHDDEFKTYRSLDFAKIKDEFTDTSLFYLIDRKCAISIMPDTSWIREQQDKMSETDFETMADDYGYYIGFAEDSLRARGIEISHTMNDRRYLKFRKTDNQLYIIDRNKMKDESGLILFNGVDDPVFWFSNYICDALEDIYGM